MLDASGAVIPVSEISVADFDSEETVDAFNPAAHAIDGDSGTFWHTEWGAYEAPLPHHLTLDLGSVRAVGGYEYVPRQDSANGRIANYEVHHSSDGTNWIPMDSGTWSNGTGTRRFDEDAGRRPARCQLAGPSGTVGGAFDVTVVFDMAVDDFDGADLQVTGGSVAAVRGVGYYYVATILPTAATVSVSVPADAVDPEGEGSLASAVLSVDFIDTLPPVPVFSGVAPQVTGTFDAMLGFGEEVNGLDASDLIVTNGTLDAIVAEGFDYRLTITPASEGTVRIDLVDGAVVDTVGNVMGGGVTLSTLFLNQRLWFEAEAADIVAGFEVVADASASGGAYLWTPQESRSTWDFDASLKVSFAPVIPRTGDYRVRGTTRSDDFSSDSFYLGFDGDAGPDPWHTNQDGNVGTGQFHLDIANSTRNPLTSPSVFTLSAGAHTMELYARDDGTRIDTIWLESVRPLTTLVGPAGAVAGPFTVSVSFSEAVTGFEASDVLVTGGSVTDFSGVGATYQVELSPAAGSVAVQIPEGVAVDDEGALNHASNPFSSTVLSAYEVWALAAGVDGTVATSLADEDRDGIAKLLEFAFGLDPAVSDRRIDDGGIPASGLPRVRLSEPGPSGRLELTYLRRRGATGLTYEPEFGDGPASFSAATAVPSVEGVDEEWERVTVLDTENVGTAPRRFGRVRVTLSP